MVKEWIFQDIEFSPTEAWLQIRTAQTEDWFAAELAAEISIVSCYDLTELEPNKDKTTLSSSPIVWEKKISLLGRESTATSRIALLQFCKGVRKELAKADLSLLNINPTSPTQLKLLDEAGLEIGSLSCRISEIKKSNIPVLILKAIRCELIRDE